MLRALGIAALLVASLREQLDAAETTVSRIQADPPRIELIGPGARHTLLIHGTTTSGAIIDLTHAARLEVADALIAVRLPDGSLKALRDGETTVAVRYRKHSLTVPIRVTNTARPRQYHFENDIEPLFGRFGCNASGCHGKAEGQNGFKLSVFGFDPVADYAALTKEARGRRVFPAAAEHSLLLEKAAGRVPHGGGNRIPVGSDAYETLRGWIASGCPIGSPDASRVERLRVEPGERILGMRATQQLRVMARFTDGTEADVTRHARFQSNQEAIAAVSAEGLISTSDVPGEAAVMAAYMNETAVFRALVPRAESVQFPALPVNNFIDPLVDAKLRKLNIVPSGPADDAEFLRRVYLDIIGTLPTPDEARTFLADKAPDRRAKLVDHLLDRPEYADYWALKWSDVLRVDRAVLGSKRAYAYYRWVRESLATNQPIDRFASDIITAEGPLDEVAAANFYRVANKPGEAASTLSQVFLGVRIACAECHHHPFDRWSQDDYYGFAAFFSPVAMKRVGTFDTLEASGDSSARNPRTGQSLPARSLGTSDLTMSLSAQLIGARRISERATAGDQRGHLASWLTAPQNPWFARNVANRYWAHFLGRGLVEPVDDVRATNPPSNPELLDALAKHLVDSKYDLKQLVRTIVASRTYQTTATPNAANERDEQNYSRALFKRVDAEVLLDMVCQTTGVAEKFQGVSAGARAIQLWDSKVNHYFLKLFGRPARTSACECERNAEPSVGQVLHLLNSPEIDAKLRHDDGTIARLVRAHGDDARIVEDLYLRCYARYPTEKEQRIGLDYLAKHKADRRRGAEDLAWALMNSLEFISNH